MRAYENLLTHLFGQALCGEHQCCTFPPCGNRLGGIVTRLAGVGITQANFENAVWERQLRDIRVPDLDPGIDEALLAFMAKRKETLPDGVA